MERSITINGKTLKELETMLAENISASDKKNYSLEVKKRLREVFGFCLSIESKIEQTKGGFLSQTALVIRDDAGNVITRRDGIAHEKECELATENSINQAANLFGVPLFINVENKQQQLSLEGKQQAAGEQQASETPKDAARSDESTKSAKSVDNGNYKELKILSEWREVRNRNQHWCMVDDGQNKAVFTIGELAAEKIEETYPLKSVLTAYKPGTMFKCFAEKRVDSNGSVEYVMTDVYHSNNQN